MILWRSFRYAICKCCLFCEFQSLQGVTNTFYCLRWRMWDVSEMCNTHRSNVCCKTSSDMILSFCVSEFDVANERPSFASFIRLLFKLHQYCELFLKKQTLLERVSFMHFIWESTMPTHRSSKCSWCVWLFCATNHSHEPKCVSLSFLLKFSINNEQPFSFSNLSTDPPNLCEFVVCFC